MVPKTELGKLPMFISEIYIVYQTALFNIDFILIEYREADGFSIPQLEKHFDLLKNSLHKRVVLLTDDLPSIYRKRLIGKGINFIMPEKQLFLPDFLIDLREGNQNQGRKRKTEKLLPSSQLILLYYILHNDGKANLKEESFTQLASKFGYTKMAITKAVENLLYNGLCIVEGTKEKYIRFVSDGANLWKSAFPLLVNPVFKKVYVDEKPQGIFLYRANESALSEYSNMNPIRQTYYSIERSKFYELQKEDRLKNPNEFEGMYCLELWKYNPAILTQGITKKDSVDPLSLYLSLQDNRDERVEMALDTISKKFLW
jgi:hypothetical protein